MPLEVLAERLKKILVFVLLFLLAACAAFCLLAARQGHFSSVPAFRAYVLRFGALGPVVLAAVQAIQVILPVLPPALLDEEPLLYINPTGRFVIGGPAGDAGLTGRKAVSDAYGGAAHHGGGSLAGKDPTKMDRTGAYLARYLAKNVVAAGLADRCEVQLAYAIGLADPVSVSVNTFGTGMIRDETLAVWLENHVDMRPGVVIRRFGLTRPIYRGLAAYGPFGENGRGMPWERTDLRFPAQF